MAALLTLSLTVCTAFDFRGMLLVRSEHTYTTPSPQRLYDESARSNASFAYAQLSSDTQMSCGCARLAVIAGNVGPIWLLLLLLLV